MHISECKAVLQDVDNSRFAGLTDATPYAPKTLLSFGFDMTDHALSPLDQAHAHRLAGDTPAALRLGIACAHTAPDAPGPIALIARVLVDEGRTMIGPEIAARLVDACIRRGDLPAAVIASQIALDAGEDHTPLLKQIADAFGKGSPRLSDAAPKPPPFPKLNAMPPALAKLAGDELFGQAEVVLTKYLNANDPVANDTKLPTLSLFSALAPAALARLLKTVRIDDVSGGDEIVRQGDQGREAFVVARGLLRVVRLQGADETVLAQLGPGAILGEMALMSSAPRSASVQALEPAQLLVLDREQLERAAQQAPELSKELAAFCHQRMQQNLIRQARVFAGLRLPERTELLASLESRFFERGELLIARGQEAERVLLIASGAVSVSIPEGGDVLVLATLGAGEVVGEMSMILRRPSPSDARALHPTLTFEIRRDRLRELTRKYPGLLVELYDLATRRDDEVRAATEHDIMDVDDVILV